MQPLQDPILSVGRLGLSSGSSGPRCPGQNDLLDHDIGFLGSKLDRLQHEGFRPASGLEFLEFGLNLHFKVRELLQGPVRSAWAAPVSPLCWIALPAALAALVALLTFVLLIVLRPRNAPRIELPNAAAASHLALLALPVPGPAAREPCGPPHRALCVSARTWHVVPQLPGRALRETLVRGGAGSRVAIPLAVSRP